jgi:epoxyqueuosine reductase
MLSTTVIRQLETCGYRGGIVSIEHLPQLQEEIEAHHRQGLLDETFYEERLTGFAGGPPESLPEARSLIVMGVRDPHVRFTFTWNGRRIPLTVPPTYLHSRETDAEMARVLQEILGPADYRVAPATVPKKLLAAHSGLAGYGRNNVTYVAGMGSYYRLAAFASDLPCERDDWQEPRMLERCETCRACLRRCPTGAISPERFLLHAERCITFLNEKPGEEPFPAWLHASWHNCLVGCLHCQEVCPETRDVATWVKEGAEFSSEETALLLDGVPVDQLPAGLVRKLGKWDLNDLLDILPRNLAVLCESRAA